MLCWHIVTHDCQKRFSLLHAFFSINFKCFKLVIYHNEIVPHTFREHQTDATYEGIILDAALLNAYHKW